MADAFTTLLLTPEEMGRADKAAALSGIDSYGLMERAGQAVAAAALRLYPEAKRFVVLCGPGNNGGDGYVAARALAQAGAETTIHALADTAGLKGDAAEAHRRCALPVAPLSAWRPAVGDVVIDAVFGAGLARDVPPDLARVIREVGERELPVVAVDLPSGLDGLTGQIRGAAFMASHTVTFMTAKPGHALLPGRQLCGPVEIFDIGIPHRIVNSVAGRLRVNRPGLWTLPDTDASSHKFRRGHLAVFAGGPSATGAARLSASAGLRAGAGLVTVGATPEAVPALAAHLTAVMIREIGDPHVLADWIADPRLTAFVLGPGFGTGKRARDYVELLAGRPLVLDADGITSFRDNPDQLFSLYEDASLPTLVMTPHEGEFARLFPDIAGDAEAGKVEKACRAAARARAVIVYKGADTVIAAPDGRAFINDNAPPDLATAGSGDVLAGIIGGLLAQGMPAFEAAAAGVWLHGEAGKRAGAALTAEDLPEALHHVLRQMAVREEQPSL
ncbi:NAD(P)H-hydrate dehydratase [Gellertiella hungarica]|uniref:Bifunctional NAD(P)H-hydrate repair enzyme n=1 Tax=Gellertiella hungarica TaxID=1572859 RepID=A0A7W6J4R5_9HYPH|nr:NAD(P)H-hydrate dehydratase [Gellertiella hungarica]MBB4064789.1 NAD(P)H-hydrate epimerase [Gellertiella hungarica]